VFGKHILTLRAELVGPEDQAHLNWLDQPKTQQFSFFLVLKMSWIQHIHVGWAGLG
jgi:hypothetical protein